MTSLPLFEAVYYSGPVPRSKMSLTIAGLVYDRIHFPNVALPATEVDMNGIVREANRIESAKHHPAQMPQVRTLVGVLRLIAHMHELREFCTFTAEPAQMFGGPTSEAKYVVNLILEATGVRFPEGMIISPMHGYHKELPGGGSVDYPGEIYYPAMALVYSAKNDIPLFNDAPDLPVPGVGGLTSSAAIASVIAMKCVEFALPIVPNLSPAQIVELRSELKPQLSAFRAEMLRLSGRIQEMLGSDLTIEEIKLAAERMAQTTIRPSLSDLGSAMAKPRIATLQNAMEAAAAIPVISAAAAISTSAAFAAAFAALGKLALNIRKDQSDTTRSPLYYLMELREKASKRGR